MALPAFDRLFAFQLFILAVAFARISVKVVDLGLPWKVGQPKYLPRDARWGILKLAASVCLCALVALREKTREDLWKLMSWLCSAQKLFRIFLRLLHVVTFALQNNRLSSVKNKHGIVGLLGQTFTPIPDLDVLAALLIARLRTFIQRMNKYGDKGSPCLRPLDGLKKPLGA